MSIMDEIHKAAQKSQNSSESDKILQFPTEYVPYQAFYAPTSDPQLRFKIWAGSMQLMPRYDLLYDVPHTGLGDFVGLVFPHMQVKMFGRNLIPLVDKLSTHSVEWICQYRPPFWEFAPGEDDGTLPCIEEIIIEGNPLDPEAEIRARNSNAS